MNAHVVTYYHAMAAEQLRAASFAPLALRVARIHNASAALTMAAVEKQHQTGE